MYIYSLQSTSNPKRFYIGTTENVEKRLEKHNNGEVPYTSKYRPWKLVLSIWFENKDKAFKFEQYLKTASGRAFSKKHF